MIEEQSSICTSSIENSLDDTVENDDSQTDQEVNAKEVKSLGHYCQINQDGWIEQKRLLDTVSPNQNLIDSFVYDKEANVINGRQTQANSTIKKIKVGMDLPGGEPNGNLFRG